VSFLDEEEQEEEKEEEEEEEEQDEDEEEGEERDEGLPHGGIPIRVRTVVTVATVIHRVVRRGLPMSTASMNSSPSPPQPQRT
jgi:hypothetical protein